MKYTLYKHSMLLLLISLIRVKVATAVNGDVNVATYASASTQLSLAD